MNVLLLICCALMYQGPGSAPAGPGGGAPLESNVLSLKGLSGVMGWVTFIPNEVANAGLSQDRAQQVIAGELSERGVKAYRAVPYQDSPAIWRKEGQPSLTIDVSFDWDKMDQLPKTGRLGFSVLARFYQNCRLERDPPFTLALVTWSTQTEHVQGTVKDLERMIRYVVDQFAAAYNLANKKIPPAHGLLR